MHDFYAARCNVEQITVRFGVIRRHAESVDPHSKPKYYSPYNISVGPGDVVNWKRQHRNLLCGGAVDISVQTSLVYCSRLSRFCLKHTAAYIKKRVLGLTEDDKVLVGRRMLLCLIWKVSLTVVNKGPILTCLQVSTSQMLAVEMDRNPLTFRKGCFLNGYRRFVTH